MTDLFDRLVVRARGDRGGAAPLPLRLPSAAWQSRRPVVLPSGEAEPPGSPPSGQRSWRYAEQPGRAPEHGRSAPGGPGPGQGPKAATAGDRADGAGGERAPVAPARGHGSHDGWPGRVTGGSDGPSPRPTLPPSRPAGTARQAPTSGDEDGGVGPRSAGGRTTALTTAPAEPRTGSARLGGSAASGGAGLLPRQASRPATAATRHTAERPSRSEAPVEVTIDRIDVRVEVVPADRGRVEPSSPQVRVLSLEDYLTARDRR